MTEVNFGTSTNTFGGSFISCLLGRFSGQFSSHRFWGTAVDDVALPPSKMTVDLSGAKVLKNLLSCFKKAIVRIC